MTDDIDGADVERELSAVVADVRERARSAADRQAFLAAVCERLVAAGLYAVAWYGKLDIDAERPDPVATATATGETVPDAAIAAATDTGLTSEAFRIRSIQSRTALRAAASDGAVRTLVETHGIGSIATVPVMPADAGVPYGVLIVCTRRSDAFRDDETALLSDVATATGRGIESIDAGRTTAGGDDTRRIDGIARAIPGLLFIYDDEGRYEEILTPQYVRNFTTPEDLIGRTVHDVLPDDVADRIHGAIQRALGTGEPQDVEYSLAVAGEEVWIDARIAPLDPSIDDRVVFVGRHITERKEYEKQLERYERLFENATDCIVESEFVDGEPIVRSVNAAFEETFGHAESDVVGEHLDDLITPDEYDDEASEINDRIRRGEEFTAEVTRMTADGPREFLLRPAHFDDDVSYTIYTDITERKRRERELERKNEFLDEFASVVSHDIATPLSVIENKARLIELTGDTSHAEDIYDATERVQELIDELRALATQGKQLSGTEPVEFEDVAREAWHAVGTAGATLTVESSRAIEASDDRLRQLLENLLENAVKHGGTGDDPVAIRAGTSPAGFYVADDGPGIDAENRDAAFEQGYTTDDDGTGLGLTIVRRIVEGHGWTIGVTESVDGGARFEIRTEARPDTGGSPARF